MVAWLNSLRRPVSKAKTAAPRVPSDMRVYAVGDIHGRSDLLDQLLEAIDEDCTGHAGARPVLVFLGDYIDRGPDSAGVLERLATLADSEREAFFILGNHEEALLRILSGEVGLLDDWLRFGGEQCLASYGASADVLREATLTDVPGLMQSIIPQRHLDFLAACDDSITIGNYLFVHAGIRPGLPLSAQRQADLRWIREPFLGRSADHGAVVVHGHSIREKVDWQDNRIGLDTGAYRTGVLTALALSGSRRKVIQAKGSLADQTQ